MKKLLFLFLIVTFAVAYPQSSAKSMQEIMNYNYNFGRLYGDTLRVTTVPDTVLLTGKAFNVLVWPLDGDVTFRTSMDSRYWAHWMTLPEDNILTLSGGEVDSLFLKSAGAVNVNVIYTSF